MFLSTKKERGFYILGHSCQAIAVLGNALKSVFAIPLVCRIHEGIITSDKESLTLLDKMVLLLQSLKLPEPVYFVADAYYASGNVIKSLFRDGHHLITRVRSNAVAYEPVSDTKKPAGRGRPKKYGKKIKMKELLVQSKKQTCKSPVYGENNVIISFSVHDLFWRPSGCLVRFVLVQHPHRGSIILMTSDINLDPVQIIRLYALRFKIELSFKQALRTVGAFAYHFWMANMKPISKNQKNMELHKKDPKFRKKVLRKIDAYHKHIQRQRNRTGQQLIHYWLPDSRWVPELRLDFAPLVPVRFTALFCIPIRDTRLTPQEGQLTKLDFRWKPRRLNPQYICELMLH